MVHWTERVRSGDGLSTTIDDSGGPESSPRAGSCSTLDLYGCVCVCLPYILIITRSEELCSVDKSSGDISMSSYWLQNCLHGLGAMETAKSGPESFWKELSLFQE